VVSTDRVAGTSPEDANAGSGTLLSSPHRSGPSGFAFAVIIAGALAVGALLRLPPVLAADFPLNDGGLFDAMLRAVRAAVPALPRTVSYNGLEIPFAYPPLGFLLGAGCQAVAGSSSLEILRFFPLALNLLSLLAFCFLARAVLQDTVAIVGATLLFAVLPRAFEWLIMGGGLTRSPGLFFTLLALMSVYRGMRHDSVGAFFLSSVALAAAILSHPEWAVSATVALTLAIATRTKWRRGVRLLSRIAALTALLIAPWLIVVLTHHGVAPFRAAFVTGTRPALEAVSSLCSLGFLQTPGVPLSPALIAGIGCAVLVARREFFLPVWLVAVMLTTPRHGSTAATVPLALVGGVGAAALGSWLAGFVRGSTIKKTLSLAPGVGFAAVLLLAQLRSGPATWLAPVTQEARAGMEWIRMNTPEDARFVVLTPAGHWSTDGTAEWFPVLAARVSLTTVQGLEWFPAHEYAKREVFVREIKNLQVTSPASLASESMSFGREAGGRLYVAVFIPGAGPDWGGFRDSGRYRLVLSTPGALVFSEAALHHRE